MKIHIWGSLSGTEPMPERHHSSWALEKDDILYWFDAGEGCSRTAYLQGYDPRRIKKLFISHSHGDHIGGLYNLFLLIWKLNAMKVAPAGSDIEATVPDPEVVELVKQLIERSNKWLPDMKLAVRKTSEGILSDEDGICVECVRNNHITPAEDGSGASYSFLIKCENKRIIFSGDVRSSADMECFLKDGCDLLMMETGHHSAPKLCQEWKDKGFNIGKVLFIHHGREILADPAGVKARCEAVWSVPVIIAHDGLEMEI